VSCQGCGKPLFTPLGGLLYYRREANPYNDKPQILLTVGTILTVIGFAIPGFFGLTLCLIGGSLLGTGLADLILP
jgi:hypothetical protein